VKDQLNLSVSIAVGSSIVSLLHCFSCDNAHVAQANHSLGYSVSVRHIRHVVDTDSWNKVHGHPWMDHRQATGFTI
jgi:hypothetical protein